MSIDLNWEAITGGPEGDALALSIRDFIHEKFQTVPLPRFLKSVKVHSFSFGDIAPDLELKDITDPLPDFYEENPDADDADSGEDEEDLVRDLELERRRRTIGGRDAEERFRDGLSVNDSQFWRAQTPAGIPGGTSNLHYFQQTHLSAGWSGAQTPLAAVAGAQLAVPWSPGGSVGAAADHAQKLGKPPKWPLGRSATDTGAAASAATVTATAAMAAAAAAASRGGHSRNASVGSVASEDAGLADLRDRRADDGPAVVDDLDTVPSAAGDDEDDEADGVDGDARSHASGDSMPRFRAPRPDDVQVVFRIRYAGDIKLLLTAEILLDYPMPSFVGIPVKLNVTGLTFDGVGVLAHIRKRVHFCFLSPEDALAAVGPDGAELKEAVAAAAAAAAAAGGSTPGRTTPGTGAAGRAKKFGGLLQEIRVESEIGQRESGKQSLKNVGKVERFILEQVQRIFEDEFVYPSFWTFLV